MKFRATVTFPGEPGKQHYLGTNAPDVPECEALDKWLHGHSAGTTRSDTTLHLFNGEDDDDALCGSYVAGQHSRKRLSYGGFDGNPNMALHFATAGKKYKICLKCRKVAEGGE
tara:strand:+ start:350 stop:688 length:339 start_codon:yes stop_codon:yes gene_type:complete